MNNGNQIHTDERFKRWQWSTGVATDPIPVGVLHSFAIPIEMSRRFVWIAAGTAINFAGDFWFVQGRLEFSAQGQKTGHFHFSDCSEVLDTTRRALAVRTVTSMKPDGTGSRQPVVRYQETNSAMERNNLDMPCFEFNVEADRIDYVMERSYYDVTTGPLVWLTGMRVASTK